MDPTMTNDATAPPPDAAAILSNPDLDQTIPQQQPPTYQPPTPPISPASHIENYAAAVHHSRLSHALNTVADILGGPKTLRLQKNADGTVDMTQVDATPGEKWGRVAAAALQGAATGFAVGQGPGGAQRAAAASVQQGMAAPQQNQQNLIKEGERQENQNRQRMMFNANMAMQHQQLVKATFDNMTAPVKFSQEQTKFAVDLNDTMTKQGASVIATYKDPDELAAQFNSNPQLQQGHLGDAGMVLPVNTYGPDGKVNGGKIYYIPEDKRHQLNTVAMDVPFHSVDEKGNITTTMTHIEPHTMELGQIVGATTGALVQGNQAAQQASQMKTAQQEAQTRADTAKSEARLRGAQAGEAAARTDLIKAQTANLPKPTPQGGLNGPDGKPLTGEAYLQASGIDPSQWNQIRAVSKGDVKIAPPGTRNPQAAALRNAVMNFDPTFTDARYDTRQNFKTKGDSVKLGNLSTALNHLEEAKSHIGYTVPGSPEWAKYQTAITNFTNEAGKVITGGDVALEKYNDLKSKVSSNIPYIRNNALDEMTKLMGGRVQSMFENYKRGAGHDLPVEDFFTPETQERLNRYGLTNAPAATPSGAAVAGQNGNPAAPPKLHSIAKAKALPFNAGKTDEEIKQDLIKNGYTPIP